jgi:hypothetical protein
MRLSCIYGVIFEPAIAPSHLPSSLTDAYIRQFNFSVDEVLFTPYFPPSRQQASSNTIKDSSQRYLGA